MLIDWFTVIAQAFNFLILVWLLKRFLYAPILGAIDAREKRMAAEQAQAAANRTEATAARDEFRRRIDEFDGQRIALLDKAKADAATERQRLLEAARSEADSLRARQQAQLVSEYQSMGDELARRIQAEVFEIARRVLADLADASLESRMVESFLARLAGLDAAARQTFAAQSSPVQVRSAFELPEALRGRVENSVREALGGGRDIGFETVPALISGIELVLQGRKIAWSVEAHVSELDKAVHALIRLPTGEASGAP